MFCLDYKMTFTTSFIKLFSFVLLMHSVKLAVVFSILHTEEELLSSMMMFPAKNLKNSQHTTVYHILVSLLT